MYRLIFPANSAVIKDGRTQMAVPQSGNVLTTSGASLLYSYETTSNY